MTVLRSIYRVLILAGVLFAQSHVVQAQHGAASPAAATPLTDAQKRADILFVSTEFMAREKSYSTTARAKAQDRLAQLERRAASLTPVALDLAIAQVVALADNAHSIAAPAERALRYNRIPLRLVRLKDDIVVIRARSDFAGLLGARLRSIDGHQLQELRDSARTLVGGPDWRRDKMTTPLFESPEQLNAFGLTRGSDRATYVFERDGQVLTRELVAEREAPGAMAIRSELWLYPEVNPGGSASWRGLLAADKAPWSLHDAQAAFRWQTLPNEQAFMIEMRRVFNAPGQPIADFLNEMAERIRVERPRNLILDLRMNGGGNLQTARDFAKMLPTLVPGKIFVLTSPWTFSAAISTIGYLKQAAPDRVTIVGEPAGDRLEFWAEGRGVRLPSSGIMLYYSTERHDYQNGCKSFSDCHRAVVDYPIAVASLTPDIAAPWTVEAYAAGRDPAMEAVMRELKLRL